MCAWVIKGPGEGGPPTVIIHLSPRNNSELILSECSISKRQFLRAARRGQVSKKLVSQQPFHEEPKDKGPRGAAKNRG